MFIIDRLLLHKVFADNLFYMAVLDFNGCSKTTTATLMVLEANDTRVLFVFPNIYNKKKKMELQ